MLPLASVALLFMLAVPPPGSAQFYRWVDERGGVHYVEGIDNVPERYRSTAVRLGLRNVAPEPATPAGPPGASATAPAGATVIRYQPGERIVVDAWLNGETPVRLVLDTGADRTLIAPRALVAAGAALDRPVARGELHGVTGRDEVSWILLESLAVGDVRVEKIPVGAYEIGTRDADGLLGRDFLDRFTVAIDAGRGVVTLTPR